MLLKVDDTVYEVPDKVMRSAAEMLEVGSYWEDVTLELVIVPSERPPSPTKWKLSATLPHGDY